MLNRRNFLKVVGISPVVLVSVKAVGEVPKEVPESYKKNLNLRCLTPGTVRFRLRPMMRRARIYSKNAHYFILHLNWQDSEDLMVDFKKSGFKNAEFTEGLTLHHVEIKWYCDTDVSFIAAKAPLRGQRFPEIHTATKRLTQTECKLFCQKMRRSSK